MAAELVQKELRKLLLSVPGEVWPALDANVADWFDGTASQLAPAHDFWNGAEGITQGFKLKRLVRYISAENITWEKTEMAVDDIPITWGFPQLKETLGAPPYSAGQIREAVKDDAVFRRRLTSELERHAHPPRDHYPIYVFDEPGGNRLLLDGNRRNLNAILRSQPKILAYLGAINNPPLRNYWVSSGFLRNLVRIAETANDRHVTEAVTTTLRSLFTETVIARINYQERVCSQSKLAREIFAQLTAGTDPIYK